MDHWVLGIVRNPAAIGFIISVTILTVYGSVGLGSADAALHKQLQCSVSACQIVDRPAELEALRMHWPIATCHQGSVVGVVRWFRACFASKSPRSQAG